MARGLKTVDAHTAAKLHKDGALLVDVRESGEHAQARIPGSQLVSLSRFGMSELPLAPGQAVVFFCASGGRTSAHATRLAEKAGTADAYVMQGGISAWRQAGLPVESGSGSSEDVRPGFLSRVFGR
jgi:rhodanese-related sulfurtransferase